MTASEVGRTTSGSSSSLPAGVGHDGELGGEALHVLGLAPEVALRDEQREVGVLVPGRLDPAVQVRLEELPDAVAVGADDHRAPDRPPVGELGAQDQLVVPGGEVLALAGQLPLVALGHGRTC